MKLNAEFYVRTIHLSDQDLGKLVRLLIAGHGHEQVEETVMNAYQQEAMRRDELSRIRSLSGAKGGRPKKQNESKLLSNPKPTPPPVEMKFPAWAGEKTKQMWEQFKTYRAGQHKFKYKTSTSEQQAINVLGRYFKNGKECVIALEHTMAKGWMFPVDPSEYKYPSAEEVQQYKFTPQE